MHQQDFRGNFADQEIDRIYKTALIQRHQQPAAGHEHQQRAKQQSEETLSRQAIGHSRISQADCGQQYGLRHVHQRQILDAETLQEQGMGGTAADRHTRTDQHEKQQEMNHPTGFIGLD